MKSKVLTKLFKPNRSTIAKIITLRIVIEQSKEWNSDLFVNFIDYKKNLIVYTENLSGKFAYTMACQRKS